MQNLTFLTSTGRVVTVEVVQLGTRGYGVNYGEHGIGEILHADGVPQHDALAKIVHATDFDALDAAAIAPTRPLTADDVKTAMFGRTPTAEDIAAAIALSKREILDEVRFGRIPAKVTSFSDLHDYVDANEFGGICDADSGIDWNFTEPVDAVNVVQDAVHAWIVAGGIIAGSPTVRTEGFVEGPRCGMTRPETLGFQRCVRHDGHDDSGHRSQDGKVWGAAEPALQPGADWAGHTSATDVEPSTGYATVPTDWRTDEGLRVMAETAALIVAEPTQADRIDATDAVILAPAEPMPTPTAGDPTVLVVADEDGWEVTRFIWPDGRVQIKIDDREDSFMIATLSPDAWDRLTA